jgi:hypothetical protein
MRFTGKRDSPGQIGQCDVICGHCQRRFHAAAFCTAVCSQPCGLTIRSSEAGLLANLAAGRTGRRTSSPPQLGHSPLKGPSAQSAQNVHSKEQIRAFRAAGGKSTLQHSQFGRSCSMVALLYAARSARQVSTSTTRAKRSCSTSSVRVLMSWAERVTPVPAWVIGKVRVASVTKSTR